SEQARQTALKAVAKWYQKSDKDFLASEPALWIYDESLLRASTRPTELVWRLEVTPKEAGMPVRELVLVNAHRGGISLHFNRVDTAWMVSADATLDRTEKAMPAADPSNEGVTDNSSTDPMPALLGATWFVATTGNDSNSCSSAGSPCKTINGAIGKASTGDLIKVAVGTYTGTGTDVVLINKSVNLSGGWNAAFTAQSGISTIDAQKARRGVSVSAATSFERFIVTNGNAKAVNLNGLGGGVYILADVSVTFTNSSIQNNVAQVGGGIYKTIGSQSLTINNSTVVNNLALNGGGMEVDSSSLILNNSTVYNNSATAVGGGINIYNTTLTLNNSTISKNLASYIGGGIFAHTASMTVTNTTISKNSSTDSGGGIYIQAATGSNVSLKNSILGENFSQAAPDCAGALSSNGNNIISSTSGCTVTAATGDKFNISPGLGPFLVLQGYHPLLPSSPAINAGNSATCLSTDQRGVARVGICDIGAYEYTAPGPAASLSIVSGVGQRTPPKFAFIRAFQVVALDSQGSPVPNVNITFTAPGSGASGTFANTGNSTTSVLTGAGGIAVTSLFTANAQFGAYNVSVSASGLSPVNISLENAGWYVSPAGNDSNSCSVPGSPCETINAAINKALPEDTVVVGIGTYAGTDTFVVTIPMSLRLSGGWNTGFTNQTGASIIDGQHAREGVFVHGGVLTTATLERLAIVNGNVESSTGVEGGGIYNGAILTLNNVTVSNNFAYYGGGIYNSSYGILTLNNVTLSNNGAWLGGGLFNTAGTLTLKNTLVGNNSAGQGPDCIGAIDASTYSLISSEADCTVANGPGNLLNVQPRLGIFNFTEGYHSLVVGSPAIDAGNPAVPGSGGNACLLTDQRGVVRPVGVRCDIGAYEGAVAWTYRPLVSTHSAGNATSLPGAFICNQEDPNCSAGDFHAKAAHKYALGTYYLYAARHGRDSINNNGMTIISTVHYDTNYDNAFWNGNQMVYGDRYEFPLADDVVAHELTHGITQYESNLFYYYQSGAINESFSDLWGEFYDQTNSQGNDSSEVKWQMGEDVPDLGELRSLSDPPAYGDPDKMSSSFYYEGEEDNGGVHTNSGVSNKAVYLLVEGGLFNGKTVTALGWNKTAAIYYEVNTKLLSSGADYSDLYYALQQACTNLVGQQEITSSDCVEVRDAIDAVEMNGQPAPNFNTDAPLCPAESVPSMVSIDNLEAGTANWVFQNGALPRWQWDSPLGPYAQSGNHSLYADDSPDTITDASARWAARAIPNDAYLHFAHAYGFESGYNPGDPTFHHFDGGVLEYSINSGSTWVDAGALIDFNGYQGTLFTGAGNPLSGRSAFVGDSHGYISTRLNLAALAGKTVAFRWRMGLDEAAADWGWWVDNVKLYICTPPPGAFNKTSPSNGGTGVGLSTILSWSSSSSAPSYQYCYDIINDSQCNRTWIPVPSTSAGISNLGASTTYYWQVRAVNGAGTTYADSQSWGSFTTTSILPAGLTEIETLVGTTK
ncbi:MAG TPA: M4 family metallopeptidase, partial [Anaerolineales bacterium]|nr:M4 family metallopeptidase [Anaerolineales bacterium]